MFNKLLIPIDGSPLVRGMIKKLTKTLNLSDKQLMLIHVAAPLSPTIYSESALSDYYISKEFHQESAEEFAQKIFKQYKKFLGEAKSISLLITFNENISSGIVKAAKKNKVDCIVMASHRYTGLDNILLGNKVHQVIISSKFPVLVL
jgi:nucleotide-binding universal stress UspA family protein